MGVCRVALVSPSKLLGKRPGGDPVTLGVTAVGANLRVGGQPDLEAGLGHDDDSDVTTLDHRVAEPAELPLTLTHHRPHLLVAGDDRDGGIDLGLADLGGHVVAADRNRRQSARR